MATNITITIDIPADYLARAVNGAGIDYWGRLYDSHHGWSVDELDGCDDETAFAARGMSLTDCARGAAKLMLVNPMHFGLLTAGTPDANTGDLLIQLSIFGEIKYA